MSRGQVSVSASPVVVTPGLWPPEQSTISMGSLRPGLEDDRDLAHGRLAGESRTVRCWDDEVHDDEAIGVRLADPIDTGEVITPLLSTGKHCRGHDAVAGLDSSGGELARLDSHWND